jgi:hypothetical protein
LNISARPMTLGTIIMELLILERSSIVDLN